jgi:uncharacterized protein (DUF488 family)
LTALLAGRKIAYSFFGKELGGRPQDRHLYSEGVADYEKMAASSDFRCGLVRLMEAAAQHTLAVMCSEADPLDCHRFLLVGRALAATGADVRHILASGEVLTHAEAEDRLLALENPGGEGLPLFSRDERLNQAYRGRSRKSAYGRPSA